MIKLYKTTDNELYYWETWDNENNSASIHWGKVGDRGEVKTVKSRLFSNFRKEVQKEIDKNRDVLRMAAMLHDVGKVAISDLILKKPGRFSSDELSVDC